MRCPKCGTIQPDIDDTCDVCGAGLPKGAAGTGTSALAALFEETPGDISVGPAGPAAGTEEAERAPDRAAEDAAAAPGLAPDAPHTGGAAAAPRLAPDVPRTGDAAAGPRLAPDVRHLCDMCNRAFPLADLKIARGQWLCSGCRAQISEKILDKVEEGSGVRSQSPAKPDRAGERRTGPGKRSVPGAGRQYVAWPGIKLTDEEQGFQTEWKNSRGELSRPMPIRAAFSRFTGPFVSLMILGGLALVAGGAAVAYFAPQGVVSSLLAALLVMPGLISILIGIDGRGGLRVDERGFWREALISSKRVFWPVVVSVELLYKPLPSILGGLYAGLVIRFKTKDQKAVDFMVPCPFGKPGTEKLAELKKQIERAALMVGAKLL